MDNEAIEEDVVIEEVDEAQVQAERDERVRVLGQRLMLLADRQVRDRVDIEDRWIEDIRQYTGKYDARTEAILQSDKTRSRVFVNITRPKTNAAEARLGDMVLPDDDKNYMIRPTPVPELEMSVRDRVAREMEQAEQQRKMREAQQAAPAQQGIPMQQGMQMPQGIAPQGPPMTGPQGMPAPQGMPQPPATAMDTMTQEELLAEEDRRTKLLLEKEMSLAHRRAKMMEAEIDDQLQETQYNAVCRQVIHDACVLGTGILKGPVIVGKTYQRWRQLTDSNGDSVQVLEVEETKRPIVERVDPWNFFPDMAATRISEAEFVFERSFLSKRQLRELAKRPEFRTDAIEELLSKHPDEYKIDSSHLSRIREAADHTTFPDDNRYEVWAYYGAIDKEDLISCGCDVDEMTALDSVDAVIWLCGPLVLKAQINPMDTTEWPYSVMNWEKDDSSIFGYGVPYRLRNPQKVINASWRMTLENAGLSTGPQVVVNKMLVDPADKSWELRPKKVWYLKERNVNINQAFGTFEISSHQPELMAIFQSAKQLADEETSLPQIMQGSNEKGVYTQGQAQALMGAANTVLRRVVKQFDDDITLPTITRFYNWNMQYSQKEYIKGDYDVSPRASTTLMVREIQNQNLASWLQLAGNSPFAPAIKGNELLKKLAKAQHLEGDDIVKTDEEIASEEAKRQAMIQNAPEMLKIQAEERMAKYKMDMTYKMNQERLQAKDQENQIKLMVAQYEREAQMLRMANDRELSIEQIKADLTKLTMQLDSKERTSSEKTQVEAVMRAREQQNRG